MTLASVPRYNPQERSVLGDSAVVVGASIAGLCAARVLTRFFREVVVLERDRLPTDPAVRRGVPQAHHVHVLQEAGRVMLEDLFPGFGDELVSAGGLMIDASREADFFIEGGVLADGRHEQWAYSASRPLYEHVIRRRVDALEAVTVRSDQQVTDLTVGESGRRVSGVTVRSGDGNSTNLTADLVIDASGRTSHTPAWLDEHGFASPAVEEVTIDVVYGTTVIDRPSGNHSALAVLPTPEYPRGGALVPIEGGRWQMTLFGVHGDNPPGEFAGFKSFAASLPLPAFERLLTENTLPDEPIHQYPFSANLRRRYEKLDEFPEDFVVTGDAIASYNPIYGQGMSVAALEAVELHHTLADEGLSQIGPRFFDRAAASIDVAWRLAVGLDHQFEETSGPKPWGTDAMNWYLSRLLRAAHEDSKLFDAFFRVRSMERPPTSLLHPRIVFRTFKP